MYRIARTAGAVVAVALCIVATPAAASGATSPSPDVEFDGAALLPSAELRSEFKPRRCGRPSYFREHRFECIRYFRDLEERADRSRDRERFGDRDRDDRFGGERRRGPGGWSPDDDRR
ncbi:MAG: hypothetical protein ACT4QF_17790 [Sporichthyaceae bacterium]